VRAVREGEAMRAEVALSAMPLGMVHLVAGNLGQIIGVRRWRRWKGASSASRDGLSTPPSRQRDVGAPPARHRAR
jgi:hypothetical protein